MNSEIKQGEKKLDWTYLPSPFSRGQQGPSGLATDLFQLSLSSVIITAPFMSSLRHIRMSSIHFSVDPGRH